MAEPNPDQAIRRTLHTHPSLPVYAVPPPAPYSKGYTSASWLRQPPMATVSLEIIETSTPITAPSKLPPPQPTSTVSRQSPASLARNAPAPRSTRAPGLPVQPLPDPSPRPSAEADEKISISIHLLDPTTRELFAAAPYAHPSIVTPCTDSGRYFALRVADDSGRKATVGIGFERREDGFEFVAALGSAGKVLGFDRLGDADARGKGSAPVRVSTGVMDGRGHVGRADGKGTNGTDGASHGGASDAALFAIEPPPSSPAVNTYEEALVDGQVPVKGAASNDMPGIEDDEFGDFQ